MLRYNRNKTLQRCNMIQKRLQNLQEITTRTKNKIKNDYKLWLGFVPWWMSELWALLYISWSLDFSVQNELWSATSLIICDLSAAFDAIPHTSSSTAYLISASLPFHISVIGKANPHRGSAPLKALLAVSCSPLGLGVVQTQNPQPNSAPKFHLPLLP